MVSYMPKLVVETKQELKTTTIQNLYPGKLEYLTPEMPMAAAIERILSSSLNGLPVLDEQRMPVGYLSEKDCLKIALGSRYLNDSSGYVYDFMVNECKTIHQNTTLFEAVDAFMDIWYHAYPVVDDLGRVVGVIKRKDVLAEIAKQSHTSW